MARRGRRKKTEGEGKERITSVRYSEVERAIVEAKAARAGVDLSEWIRSASLEREPKAQVIVPELNREAWLELAGLAANFNRVMALINEGRDIRISRQFAENLRDHLTDLRRSLLGAGMSEEDGE